MHLTVGEFESKNPQEYVKRWLIKREAGSLGNVASLEGWD